MTETDDAEDDHDDVGPIEPRPDRPEADLPEPTSEMVLDILTAAEAAEIELPHIVICYDALTGHTLYVGPYPGAADALAAADADAAVTADLDSDPASLRSYSVAPLHRPTSADFGS